MNLKNKILFLALGAAFVFVSHGYACTAAVMDKAITKNGRPMIWKIRNWSLYGGRTLTLNHNGRDYIALNSLSQDYPLMALGQNGISIGNTLMNDIGTSGNNSGPMRRSSTEDDYDTLDEFWERYQDGTNLVAASYVMLDRFGETRMFEIGNSVAAQYFPTNAYSTEGTSNFIVRINASWLNKTGDYNGERWRSATNAISQAVSENDLTPKRVVQKILREGAHALRDNTPQAMVTEGVCGTNEDVRLTTLYALNGRPRGSMVVPFWAAVTNQTDFPYSSSSMIGNLADNIYTYNSSDRDWANAQLLAAEDTFFAAIDRIMPFWRINYPGDDVLARVERECDSDAYHVLNAIYSYRATKTNYAPTVVISNMPGSSSVQFLSQADDVDGTVVSVYWNFGDGTFSTNRNPVHSYSSTNLFLVSCTAFDDNGARLTDWKYVEGRVCEADYTLPFEETFEAGSTNMAGSIGALSGQHGWTGGGVVQSNLVHNGVQALSLRNAVASHNFLGDSTNVEITFWSQPVVSEVAPDNIPTQAAAVFYVNTNRQLVAYNSTNATVIESPVFSDDWNKIIVSCDFISKAWNLSLNNIQVVTNFDFYGSPSTFSVIEFIEASVDSTSYIDDITVVDSSDEPDTDGDGLPDDWEADHFGDLDAKPGDLATNGINTMVECYIAGLDPTSSTNRFQLSIVRSPSSVLRWNSVSSRIYAVYWSSNLFSDFTLLEGDLTGGVFTNTSHVAEEKGFYKIKVELEP